MSLSVCGRLLPVACCLLPVACCLLPVAWDQRNLDYYLNHIANEHSLLTTIDSISDVYASLKINLMQQILEAIDQPGIDLTPFYENFSLLLKPDYFSDPAIKAFLKKHFVESPVKRANSQAWIDVKAKVCDLLLNFVESDSKFDFIGNNGFFIQLILNGRVHTDLASRAESLYENYLSLPGIKPVTEMDDFGDYAKKPDWSAKDANNYVLVAGDHAMMISGENLISMLRPSTNGASVGWDNFYLYQQDPASHALTNEAPRDLGALFKEFKIFNSQYQFARERTRFTELLDLLELGDYHADFISALNAKSADRKMTRPKDQIALGGIFIKIMSSDSGDPVDMHINPQHLQGSLADQNACSYNPKPTG